MFHQLLTPVGNNLALSCLIAILPAFTVLLLLGVLRRPAWQAALAGLIIGLIVIIYGLLMLLLAARVEPSASAAAARPLAQPST